MQALRFQSTMTLYHPMCAQLAIDPVLELLAIWVFCLEHILYTVHVGNNLQVKVCEPPHPKTQDEFDLDEDGL